MNWHEIMRDALKEAENWTDEEREEKVREFQEMQRREAEKLRDREVFRPSDLPDLQRRPRQSGYDD